MLYEVITVGRSGVLVGLLTLDDLLEVISEQMALVVGLVDAEQHNERTLRH